MNIYKKSFKGGNVKKGRMIKKLVYFGLVLSIVASLLVFACTPAEEPTPTEPTPTEPTPTEPTPTEPTPTGPQYGGVIKMIANYGWTENVGYPPISPPSFSPFVPAPAVEALLRVDPTTGLPAPYLLTGWEWAADYSSITFTVKEGVKFHDGSDFNAQSIKYMLDIYMPTSPDLADVTSIEVVDDYTLKFNTTRFSNNVLYDLVCKSGAAGVVSATSVKTNGADYSITHAVGTGPFKQVSFQRNVGIVFDKFEDYWQDGKPYLDTVDVAFITDPLTAKLSFMGGEGNVVAGLTPTDAQELAATGKYEMASYPTRVCVLAPDSANPDSPWSNLAVRQAASYAIDDETLVEVFGYGLIPFTNQVLYPNTIGYNPDVVGYPYNPDKAKELLAEAGYPDGFDTTLYYQMGLGYDGAVTIAQRYLSEVGINAELQPVGSGQRGTLLTKGWDGLILYGNFLTAGYTASKTMVNYYSQDSRYFISMERPDALQAVLDELLEETDNAKMIAGMQEWNKMFIDDYCMAIPLFADITIGAIDPSIKDSLILDATMEQWTPEDAWIDD